MDIVRTLIILLSLSFVSAASSSIGSEFEASLSCSKFHFEEKVLEKLVRLELKMQILEEKMDAREKLNTAKLDEINNIMNAREKLNSAKLDEINNIKKQTETFVQSVQVAQIRDQTRFNKSYQEIVKHFQTQVDNKAEIYGDQMNALLGSLSSKMEVFTEAEKKRESVTEFMKRSLDQERETFNSSYDQIVENFKVASIKTLQELILNQQKAQPSTCSCKKNVIAFTTSLSAKKSIGSGAVVQFDKVWTNEGKGYDPNSGIFTAPRQGFYQISGTTMSPHGRYFHSYLMKNNEKTVGLYTGEGFQTGSATIVLKLEKGDRVYIKHRSDTEAIYSDGDHWSMFSGFLISE